MDIMLKWNNMYTILYLGSDAKINALDKYALETLYGHRVHTVFQEKRILIEFKNKRPDVILLHENMVKDDTYQILSEIKEIDLYVPIILIVSMSDSEIVFSGIGEFLTDYVYKEFSAEMIDIEIRFATEKSFRMKEARYESRLSSNSTFNYVERELKIQDKVITLSPKAADVLHALCQHRNEVVRKAVIVNKVWRNDEKDSFRNLDHYILTIRKYLKEDPLIEVKTMRGKGYFFSCPG